VVVERKSEEDGSSKKARGTIGKSSSTEMWCRLIYLSELLDMVIRVMSSILAALFLPHASSPSSSPPSSSLRRSPFVASLLSRLLVVFSFVFSRRRLLRCSCPSPSSRDLHLSLGFRPSSFNLWFFVRRSRRLLGSRVDSRP
jgi:hypothetical protein